MPDCDGICELSLSIHVMCLGECSQEKGHKFLHRCTKSSVRLFDTEVRPDAQRSEEVVQKGTETVGWGFGRG